MDNRTMSQRGFKLSAMSDHEFAQFIKQHDLTHRAQLIGNVYSNRAGDSVAIVVFDNSETTRRIWIKSEFKEFRFKAKPKTTFDSHIAAINMGEVSKTNIRGVQLALNKTSRADNGFSISGNPLSKEEIENLYRALETSPKIIGDYHESGLRLLNNPRNRKKLAGFGLDHETIKRVSCFRLNGFHEECGRLCSQFFPLIACYDEKGKRLFTFFNIPWQSGGNGPELI